MNQSRIEIDDGGGDDDDFLLQIAEAESAAVSTFSSTKRRLDSYSYSSDSHTSKSVKLEVKEQEGIYMAALRGSKSITWQQQQSSHLKITTSTTSRPNPNYGGGGGAPNFNASDPSIPEKNCPCGMGICSVFTANTERNQGRKFYKCPVRQENGGCGFFEWCDGASGTVSRNVGSNCGFPDLPCPCGGGSCLVLTAKTGKNVGQQFYKCPLDQGSSCGYFKWCNDNAVAANVSKVFNSTCDSNKFSSSTGDSYNKTNVPKTGSSCFKCGNDGHWARDCPSASLPNSTSPAGFGGNTSSSTTCYKCNKPGHWAKDCSVASSANSAPPADFGGRTASSGTCYKCNKPGHWARNCTST
ncbi:zinc knuckle (CCHC-type) family protein [Euphorbia peplus]|nr:zinc knuckle (CCHC-type) family protein [Euphorbia peplus]